MLFLRKLTRYYRPNVGAKYLAYGQLLRPIEFAAPDPMPVSSYKETYVMEWTVSRPSLMSGTFRAPNGDIGVFLVNISDKPLRFGFGLPPEKYPVDRRKSYQVSRVTAKGERRRAGTLPKGIVSCEGEVPPRDVVLLEAVPADE